MFHRLSKAIKPHFNLNNGVLALALFITLSWVWGTVGAIQRNFVLQQEVDNLKQEIALYELENETLAFQNKYYASQEYLELSARERLNKANPGEKVLILPPNQARPVEVSVENIPIKGIKDRSNFDQWLYFLFGKKT